MLNFSQVDGGDLADKARALIGGLPAELKRVVESDPELGARVARVTGETPGGRHDSGVHVREAGSAALRDVAAAPADAE